MMFIDNICKGWNTGQYLGDLILGHATAAPGFVLDGLVNASLTEESQYNFTSLDYMSDDENAPNYPSFSRIFALPGKTIGNSVVPLAGAIIAATIFFPHMVIHLLDEAYQKMKQKIDEAMTFLAGLSAPGNAADLPYMKKSFYAAHTVTGVLGGAITAILGLLVDGLLALVHVDTEFEATKALYKVGANVTGYIGGAVMAIVAACLHPVKKIFDKAFDAYRSLCNMLDKIVAFCMHKNGADPTMAWENRRPDIYKPSFRDKMRQAETATVAGLFRHGCTLKNVQANIAAADTSQTLWSAQTQQQQR